MENDIFHCLVQERQKMERKIFPPMPHFFILYFYKCNTASYVYYSKGMFGWGENKEDEKQGEENKGKNGIFHCLVQERKQERQKMERKIFLSGPHFFILPIWKENGEKKVLTDGILFISPTPHFIHLI